MRPEARPEREQGARARWLDVGFGRGRRRRRGLDLRRRGRRLGRGGSRGGRFRLESRRSPASPSSASRERSTILMRFNAARSVRALAAEALAAAAAAAADGACLTMSDFGACVLPMRRAWAVAGSRTDSAVLTSTPMPCRRKRTSFAGLPIILASWATVNLAAVVFKSAGLPRGPSRPRSRPLPGTRGPRRRPPLLQAPPRRHAPPRGPRRARACRARPRRADRRLPCPRRRSRRRGDRRRSRSPRP